VLLPLQHHLCCCWDNFFSLAARSLGHFFHPKDSYRHSRLFSHISFSERAYQTGCSNTNQNTIQTPRTKRRGSLVNNFVCGDKSTENHFSGRGAHAEVTNSLTGNYFSEIMAAQWLTQGRRVPLWLYLLNRIKSSFIFRSYKNPGLAKNIVLLKKTSRLGEIVIQLDF
jgi:hypothetical protein